MTNQSQRSYVTIESRLVRIRYCTNSPRDVHRIEDKVPNKHRNCRDSQIERSELQDFHPTILH